MTPAPNDATPDAAPTSDAVTPERLLLREYRPRSIYRVPQTRIDRARFPAIDMHNHPRYVATPKEVEGWLRVMDEVGVHTTVMLSGATGEAFDGTVARFAAHPERFVIWCGLDFNGFWEADFAARMRVELERCRDSGACGVGELVDKGRGLCPRLALDGAGPLHADDPRLDPVWEACADLGLPVNLHVGEDRWMYEPMDATNDGLMNAHKWQIPSDPEVLTHDAVVATLDHVVSRHPQTTFIAAHLANCCYDLSILGRMLEAYPNLYADISGRYGETAPIPRFMADFYVRYQERLVYGTDMWFQPETYRTTFRILESTDEHFYETVLFNYHWALHGFGLDDEVLQKVYVSNAARILGRAVDGDGTGR